MHHRQRVNEPNTSLPSVVFQSLGPTSLGLSFLCLFCIAIEVYFLPSSTLIAFLPLRLITAFLLALLFHFYRKNQLPETYAFAAATGMAALVLINITVDFYLDPHAAQTTNYTLLIVGLGYLLAVRSWFFVTTAVSLVVWATIAITRGEPGLWPHFTIGLVSSTVLAIVINTVRRSTLIQIAGLHDAEASRNRRLELSLQKARESERAAYDANRLKSEFLGSVSSDIRVPIHSIIGLSNLALDLELDDDQREYLETIRGSAENLLVMLTNTLDLAQIETGSLRISKEPFNLRQSVEDTTIALSHLAHQREVEIDLQIADHIPRAVKGDAARYQQILTNLVTNAIHATEASALEVEIRILAEVRDDLILKTEVRDRGAEIPMT